LRTIAVLNQKGGVGKTTTTVNVAAALAAAGQKVIAIDLDPQAHLTIHLGVEPQAVENGAYEVLTQSADFATSLMLVRPNLWLLASNINLVGAETELVNVVGREIILREAMQASLDKFDFCLIDCAPSLGLLSLNALAVAQEVLIPLQPHFLALQGFGKLLQTVDLVNKRINPHLRVTGVLLCMHDTRASLSNEVRADIEGFLQSARGSNNAWSGAVILPAFIRRNIKLAEAPSYGQTIFEYAPDCNGADDYSKVARFLLGIEDTPAPEPEPAAATHEPTPELQTDSPAQEPMVAAPTESQNNSPAEVPPADAPQNESPAQVAVVPAPPEPQSEAPAPASPAAPPIPIVSVNLPAPRTYSPAPISPEPSASAPGPESQGDAPVAAPPL
jgi:chromosome partitioning protein